VEILRKTVLVLAQATEGSPILAIIIVCLFYLAANGLSATIETLITGDRFSHWGDPVISLLFMAYAAYAVYGCALYRAGWRAD